MRSLIILFLLSSIVALRVPAQTSQEPQTVKILGISVEGNNTRNGTESGAIINNSGLRVGQDITLPGDDLRQAIQRLWALHIFSDIQILIDNKVDNGLYLSIKVTEYPRLASIDIRGADDVSKDDVMKKITIVNGQVITPDDIKKISEKIKDLYSEEGHLLATVEAKSVPPGDSTSNRVILQININEGPRVQIDHVYIKGNKAIPSDDLTGSMDDTKEKSWWQIWSHPKFEKQKFDADKKKLIKYYRKFGYLDAEITGDSIWYSSDKKNLDLLITVNEGPQYKIRSITWDGATVYSPAQLTDVLQFKPGDIFDEERFDQNLHGNPDQTDVASLYLDNGFLMFNLDPEINRTTKTAAFGSKKDSLEKTLKAVNGRIDSLKLIYDRLVMYDSTLHAYEAKVSSGRIEPSEISEGKKIGMEMLGDKGWDSMPTDRITSMMEKLDSLERLYAVQDTNGSGRIHHDTSATSRTIKKGECLWKIAREYYSQGCYWIKIWDANQDRLKNPHAIAAGAVLRIPKKAQMTNLDYVRLKQLLARYPR